MRHMIIVLATLPALANAEWVKYGNLKNGPIYYDKERATTLGNGNTSVWQKFATPEREPKMRDIDKKLLSYSHTITRSYIDCGTQSIGQASVYTYAKDGELLMSNTHDISDIKYKEIVPESASDEKSMQKINGPIPT